jgi:NO-binding membrane sensor protein with MHYT domain
MGLIAAYLNLIPGFGVGYLVSRRWLLFGFSLVGWAVAVGVGIAQARNGSACFGCEFYGAVAIAFLALSVPGSLHLFAGWLRTRRPARRRAGMGGFVVGLGVMAALMWTVEVDPDRLWVWLVVVAAPLIGSGLGALAFGRGAR